MALSVSVNQKLIINCPNIPHDNNESVSIQYDGIKVPIIGNSYLYNEKYFNYWW